MLTTLLLFAALQQTPPDATAEPVTPATLASIATIIEDAEKDAASYSDQPTHQVMFDAYQVIKDGKALAKMKYKTEEWHKLEEQLYSDQVTMYADERIFDTQTYL